MGATVTVMRRDTPWSVEEEALLMALYREARHTIAAIAFVLERTDSSVLGRLRLLRRQGFDLPTRGPGFQRMTTPHTDRGSDCQGGGGGEQRAELENARQVQEATAVPEAIGANEC